MLWFPLYYQIFKTKGILIADEAVLAVAGFTDEPGEANLKKGPFSDYPVEKLEELLAKVLAKEDYKSAARIRDVLDKKRRL